MDEPAAAGWPRQEEEGTSESVVAFLKFFTVIDQCNYITYHNMVALVYLRVFLQQL